MDYPYLSFTRWFFHVRQNSRSSAEDDTRTSGKLDMPPMGPVVRKSFQIITGVHSKETKLRKPQMTAQINL